jgi:hypothetical protein
MKTTEGQLGLVVRVKHAYFHHEIEVTLEYKNGSQQSFKRSCVTYPEGHELEQFRKPC